MKKLAAGSIVVVCCAAFAFAKGGFAPKGTAGIEIREYNGYAWVEIDAHEAVGKRPAKGSFTWDLNEGERFIDIELYYVVVEGDSVWFAGQCMEDVGGNYDDRWFFGMLYDGGTPAREGDEAYWEWLGRDDEVRASELVYTMVEPRHFKTITDGNVQVHTKCEAKRWHQRLHRERSDDSDDAYDSDHSSRDSYESDDADEGDAVGARLRGLLKKCRGAKSDRVQGRPGSAVAHFRRWRDLTQRSNW